MNSSTLRRLIATSILVGLVPISALAQDPYLGVYALPLRTASIDGELVGYATEDSLAFEVTVANEEGTLELYWAGGLAAGLNVELVRDGEPLASDSLTIDWDAAPTRYAFDGDLPAAPSVPGVLEPGVGLRSELRVRTKDGATFRAGDYTLRLTVVPEKVTVSDGSAWGGRGGLGGARFRLEDVDSPDEHKRALLIRALDALAHGRHGAAKEDFTKVIEMDPADLDGWAGLGIASWHLGRHAEAAEAMEKAMPRIVLRGQHSVIPQLLAESYVALGEPDKARSTLRAVLVEHEVEPMLEAIHAKVSKR